MRLLFSRSAILWLVLGAAGQETDQHAEWMKSIGSGVAVLRQSIEGGEAAPAAAEAKRLEATFHKVREFWGKRDAADAVRFARQAESAAAAVAKKATSGQLAAVKPDMDELAASCGSCHNVHRHRLPDGRYLVF